MAHPNKYLINNWMQKVVWAEECDKLSFLLDLFEGCGYGKTDERQSIVTVRDRQKAEILSYQLTRSGYENNCIYDDNSLTVCRENINVIAVITMEMVSSFDKVASGAVSHLINYDLPTNVHDYLDCIEHARLATSFFNEDNWKFANELTTILHLTEQESPPWLIHFSNRNTNPLDKSFESGRLEYKIVFKLMTRRICNSIRDNMMAMKEASTGKSKCCSSRSTKSKSPLTVECKKANTMNVQIKMSHSDNPVRSRPKLSIQSMHDTTTLCTKPVESECVPHFPSIDLMTRASNLADGHGESVVIKGSENGDIQAVVLNPSCAHQLSSFGISDDLARNTDLPTSPILDSTHICFDLVHCDDPDTDHEVKEFGESRFTSTPTSGVFDMFDDLVHDLDAPTIPILDPSNIYLDLVQCDNPDTEVSQFDESGLTSMSTSRAFELVHDLDAPTIPIRESTRVGEASHISETLLSIHDCYLDGSIISPSANLDVYCCSLVLCLNDLIMGQPQSLFLSPMVESSSILNLTNQTNPSANTEMFRVNPWDLYLGDLIMEQMYECATVPCSANLIMLFNLRRAGQRPSMLNFSLYSTLQGDSGYRNANLFANYHYDNETVPVGGCEVYHVGGLKETCHTIQCGNSLALADLNSLSSRNSVDTITIDLGDCVMDVNDKMENYIHKKSQTLTTKTTEWLNPGYMFFKPVMFP